MKITMSDGTIENIDYSEIEHVTSKCLGSADRLLFHNPEDLTEVEVVTIICIPSLDIKGMVSYRFQNYHPWIDLNDLPYDEKHLKTLVLLDGIDTNESNINNNIWNALAMTDKRFKEKGNYLINDNAFLNTRRNL